VQEVEQKKKNVEEQLNKEMRNNVYGWRAEVRNISFTIEGKEGDYYVYSGTMDVAFIKTDPEGPDLLIQSSGVSGWFGVLAALALVIALIFFVDKVILLVREVKPLVPGQDVPGQSSSANMFWFVLLLIGILIAAGVFLGGLGRVIGK
jgi:hypothetical protein